MISSYSATTDIRNNVEISMKEVKKWKHKVRRQSERHLILVDRHGEDSMKQTSVGTLDH